MATKTKAAKKAGRKAAKRAGKAGEAAQERAAELAEKAGEFAHEASAELAERLRKSEALAKAQRKGSELAEVAQKRWDEADLDQWAAELAKRAQKRWEQAELDKRAAEFAERVLEHKRAQQAVDKAKEATDTSLATVGGWLAKGKTGKKLGVERRHRFPTWLVAAVGLAAGFAAGRLTATRPGAQLRDEFATAADQLASAAPPVATALADTVRARLSSDPRTSGLEALSINVAEGTVFVRGTLPADSAADENAIRSVIAAVPGVTDVDLELSSATA